MAAHAATALATAASRPRGMIVLCGPAGVGKTTLAQLVVASQHQPMVHWLGDLRSVFEIRDALTQAEREPVVAVVRSGESRGLRDRWSDMHLAAGLVDRASVVTVTVRRVARTRMAGGSGPPSDVALPDLLVVEILAPDGTAMTNSLVEEARALVVAGMTTDDEARVNVPDYV